MAMLAEPKKKVKWCLNPRGKWWSEDDSKFGQKLLEKMGWTKGKGLGKNENGEVNPIPVTVKNNNSGLGFHENTEAWTVHNNEYENLLKQLEEHTTNENSRDKCTIATAEIKSKNSRKKIRYQKHIYNKDLSNYSCKDLQSILGMKINKGSEARDDHVKFNEGNKDKEEEDHAATLHPEIVENELPNGLRENGTEDKERKRKKRKYVDISSTTPDEIVKGFSEDEHSNIINEKKKSKRKKKLVSFIKGDILYGEAFHEPPSIHVPNSMDESSRLNDFKSELGSTTDTDKSPEQVCSEHLKQKKKKRKSQNLVYDNSIEAEDTICNSSNLFSCSLENVLDQTNNCESNIFKNPNVPCVNIKSIKTDTIPVKKSLYRKWIKIAKMFATKQRIKELLQLMNTMWDNDTLKTTNLHLIKGYPKR